MVHVILLSLENSAVERLTVCLIFVCSESVLVIVLSRAQQAQLQVEFMGVFCKKGGMVLLLKEHPRKSL